MRISSKPTRFLIVDDHSEIRKLVARGLRRAGYDVVEADNATTALSMVWAEQVDVIIADHHMSDVTGVELLEVVARLHPEVRRVMMTADLGANVLVEAINRGHVERFLYKPFQPNELKELAEALAKEVAYQGRARITRAPSDDHVDDGGAVLMPAICLRRGDTWQLPDLLFDNEDRSA